MVCWFPAHTAAHLIAAQNSFHLSFLCFLPARLHQPVNFTQSPTIMPCLIGLLYDTSKIFSITRAIIPVLITRNIVAHEWPLNDIGKFERWGTSAVRNPSAKACHNACPVVARATDPSPIERYLCVYLTELENTYRTRPQRSSRSAWALYQPDTCGLEFATPNTLARLLYNAGPPSADWAAQWLERQYYIHQTWVSLYHDSCTRTPMLCAINAVSPLKAVPWVTFQYLFQLHPRGRGKT